MLPSTRVRGGNISNVDSPALEVSVTCVLLFPQPLPLQIPVLPRKSGRCLAELAEGRPGILVKPKLNPLEGDTSLRSSHGQWFKKDSSAMLVLPRVRFERHYHSAVLYRVNNPTLGSIKRSCETSNYAGEPVFDNTIERTPHLKHVLADSLRNTIIDHVVLDSTFRLPPSDIISLDAVEDTFPELGGNVVQLPDAVLSWTCDKLGWIAQQGYQAWFGLLYNSDASDELNRGGFWRCVSFYQKKLEMKSIN